MNDDQSSKHQNILNKINSDNYHILDNSINENANDNCDDDNIMNLLQQCNEIKIDESNTGDYNSDDYNSDDYNSDENVDINEKDRKEQISGNHLVNHNSDDVNSADKSISVNNFGEDNSPEKEIFSGFDNISSVIQTWDDSLFKSKMFSENEFITINTLFQDIDNSTILYYCPLFKTYQQNLMAKNYLTDMQIIIFCIRDENNTFQILSFGMVNPSNFENYFKTLQDFYPNIKYFYLYTSIFYHTINTIFKESFLVFHPSILYELAQEDAFNITQYLITKEDKYIQVFENKYNFCSNKSIIWKIQDIKNHGFFDIWRSDNSFFWKSMSLIYNYTLSVSSKNLFRNSLPLFFSLIMAQIGSSLNILYEDNIKISNETKDYRKFLIENKIIQSETASKLGKYLIHELYNFHIIHLIKNDVTLSPIVKDGILWGKPQSFSLFISEASKLPYSNNIIPTWYFKNISDKMKGVYKFPLCPLLYNPSFIQDYLKENQNIILKSKNLLEQFHEIVQKTKNPQDFSSTRPAIKVDGKMGSKKKKYYIETVKQIVTTIETLNAFT